MKRILLLFIPVLLLISCDPCTECRPQYEAGFEVKFMNVDSLNSATDSLDVVDVLIKTFNRLKRVDELIQIGSTNLLQTEKLVLEDSIDRMTNLRTLVEDFSAYLATNKTSLQSIISSINSGEIKIDEIILTNTGRSIFFEDSATVYTLPLIENSVFCDYIVDIKGDTYNLEVGYELYRDYTDNHRLRLIASGIDVISHSFDSVSVSCETTDCLDGETVVTCYF